MVLKPAPFTPQNLPKTKKLLTFLFFLSTPLYAYLSSVFSLFLFSAPFRPHFRGFCGGEKHRKTKPKTAQNQSKKEKKKYKKEQKQNPKSESRKTAKKEQKTGLKLLLKIKY
ncbi:MAG: hypothetical protein GKR88_19100 [Flavobacteriaceae bacterium]|nr:MAG: hypothetical protein GKR88_19100 [Flavobacteriaceae bacterium]